MVAKTEFDPASDFEPVTEQERHLTRFGTVLTDLHWNVTLRDWRNQQRVKAGYCPRLPVFNDPRQAWFDFSVSPPGVIKA